jgi:hypothetical protein
MYGQHAGLLVRDRPFDCDYVPHPQGGVLVHQEAQNQQGAEALLLCWEPGNVFDWRQHRLLVFQELPADPLLRTSAKFEVLDIASVVPTDAILGFILCGSHANSPS